MRDYKSAVADLLLPLVNAATSEAHSPSAMLSLAEAIEAYAKRVREVRDAMPIVAEFHCCECDRKWGLPCTVLRERELNELRPDQCPPCYNKSGPNRLSAHTAAFRYLDE